MVFFKKAVLCAVVMGSIGSGADASQTFVKKKKSGPSVTECCDMGVDVLTQSANVIADVGSLQQQIIKMSREVLDGDKKCYLASANKEQLKIYYAKAQECKDTLEQLHFQLLSYTEYVKTLQ